MATMVSWPFEEMIISLVMRNAPAAAEIVPGRLRAVEHVSRVCRDSNHRNGLNW